MTETKQMVPILTGVKNILFYGDSLTDGSSYPDYVVNTLNNVFPQVMFQMHNSAKCGDTVADLLHRFERDVLPKRPDLAFIAVGTNDCCQDCDVADYERDMMALVDQFLVHNCKVVLIRPSHFGKDELEKKFLNYLCKIDQIAEKYNLMLIDVHKLFQEWEAAGLNVLGPDQIHHGKDGFEAKAKAVLNALELDDVPMEKSIKPWKGALIQWVVSDPIEKKSDDDYRDVGLVKNWHHADNELLLNKLIWCDKDYIRRGAIMTTAKFHDNENLFGFARTCYHSPEEEIVEMQIGGSPRQVIWVNGEIVWEQEESHGYHPNADRVNVKMKKGENEIVISHDDMTFINIIKKLKRVAQK